MNRNQKIIISITGITLILLILISLTYAYFLTRIQGNTNIKSVSVTTADLKLVYLDGNGLIEAERIIPGTIVDSKIFTVTNEGNVTVEYGVFLEDLVNNFERTEDLRLEVTCSSSISYKTCSGYNGVILTTNDMLLTNDIEENEIQTYNLNLSYIEAKIDQSIDMNKELSAKVNIYGLADTVDLRGTISDATTGDHVVVNSEPKISETKDEKFKVVGLEPGTHTINTYDNKGILKYSKTITIKRGAEESIDGTTITITSETRDIILNLSSNSMDISLIPFEENTLAYKIINSAKTNLNGTSYKGKPLTTPAKDISLDDEASLSVSYDDYGKSYYYRGNVVDNYINFAGMCWRIVRIIGDGSIKLILEDQDNTCETSNGNWDIPTEAGGNKKEGYFGYTHYNIGEYVATDNTTNTNELYLIDYLNGQDYRSESMSYAFENFQNDKLVTYLDKLYPGNWCFDDSAYNEQAKITDKSLYYTHNFWIIYGTSFRFKKTYSSLEIYKPTLKCFGSILNKFNDNNDMYVSALTADEAVYSGAKYNIENTNYYLINNYQLDNNSLSFWLLSPDRFNSTTYEDVYRIMQNGGLNLSGAHISAKRAFRPAITLKSGSLFYDGDGTKMNPYTIQ